MCLYVSIYYLLMCLSLFLTHPFTYLRTHTTSLYSRVLSHVVYSLAPLTCSTTHPYTLSIAHSPTHTFTHSLIHSRNHTHTYVNAHIHAQSHVHMHAHAHAHAHTHTHTHTYTHSHTHTHTHTRTHACTCTRAHACTHGHTHTHTHIHTHAHTNINTRTYTPPHILPIFSFLSLCWPTCMYMTINMWISLGLRVCLRLSVSLAVSLCSHACITAYLEIWVSLCVSITSISSCTYMHAFGHMYICFDGRCVCYFIRNSLVALLDALFTRNMYTYIYTHTHTHICTSTTAHPNVVGFRAVVQKSPGSDLRQTTPAKDWNEWVETIKVFLKFDLLHFRRPSFFKFYLLHSSANFFAYLAVSWTSINLSIRVCRG